LDIKNKLLTRIFISITLKPNLNLLNYFFKNIFCLSSFILKNFSYSVKQNLSTVFGLTKAFFYDVIFSLNKNSD